MMVGAYLAAYPAMAHSNGLADPATTLWFYFSLCVVTVAAALVVLGLFVLVRTSRNVHRALPSHLGARLDPTRWSTPSVMRLMAALGGLDDEELRGTFNGGLGMIVIVSREAVDATIDRLTADGITAAVVGEVVTAESLDGARYAEGALR